MMKNLIYAFLLVGLSPIAVPAQSLSVFTADFTPARNNSEIGASGDVQVALPFIRREKNQLLIAPHYRFLNLKAGFPFTEQQFYDLSLNPVWRHVADERWSWTLQLMPAFSSSKIDLSKKAFIWTSVLSFTRIQSPHFSYRLGLIYANRFKTNLVVPIFGFRWNPNEQWELKADLPMRFRAEWRVLSAWKTGAVVEGNRQVSRVPGYADFDYLWFREQNLIWFSDFRLIRNWWFSCRAGYSFHRELKLYQMPEQGSWEFGAKLSSSKLSPVFEYADDGFFLDFGIAYQLSR